jgi:hypothetical protein
MTATNSHPTDRSKYADANGVLRYCVNNEPVFPGPTGVPNLIGADRPCWNCGADLNVRCCEFGRDR